MIPTYCAACGARMDPDEPYMVSPAVNGVGADTVECTRHFPLEQACFMVEDSFGLPAGFLADGKPETARALLNLASEEAPIS